MSKDFIVNASMDTDAAQLLTTIAKRGAAPPRTRR